KKAAEKKAAEKKAAEKKAAEKKAAEKKAEERSGSSNPVKLAGSAGSIANSNANIRLLLHTQNIRRSPVGEKIGGLLKRTPQWSNFFGPTEIDPVQDIDEVLIAGPQLRNSSNVVAVVQHHLPRSKIDAAMNALVARGGKWLDRKKRMVEARADRAQRIFRAPSDQLVVVVPPSAQKSALKMTGKERFPTPAAREILQARVTTPYRAFRGSKVPFPESIRWVSLSVREKSGGAVIHLAGEDSSSSNAAAHAILLEKLLQKGAVLELKRFGAAGTMLGFALGGMEHRLLNKITMRSKDTMILGEVEVEKQSLLKVLQILDLLLPPAVAPKTAQSVPQKNTQKDVTSEKAKRASKETSGAASR
ncbi:MAG: hypothetical protein MK135_14590, partial [Polyangiaceae bacterium]|nr:hypothetical protein [Polyangiaceae bacterium]